MSKRTSHAKCHSAEFGQPGQTLQQNKPCFQEKIETGKAQEKALIID